MSRVGAGAAVSGEGLERAEDQRMGAVGRGSVGAHGIDTLESSTQPRSCPRGTCHPWNMVDRNPLPRAVTRSDPRCPHETRGRRSLRSWLDSRGIGRRFAAAALGDSSLRNNLRWRARASRPGGALDDQYPRPPAGECSRGFGPVGHHVVSFSSRSSRHAPFPRAADNETEGLGRLSSRFTDDRQRPIPAPSPAPLTTAMEG